MIRSNLSRTHSCRDNLDLVIKRSHKRNISRSISNSLTASNMGASHGKLDEAAFLQEFIFSSGVPRDDQGMDHAQE